jgi:hypothetical protein
MPLISPERQKPHRELFIEIPRHLEEPNMNYRLVEVNTAHASNLCGDMETHVNQLMQSGCEPIGGVATHAFFDGKGELQRIVYQPLIKREPIATKPDTGGILMPPVG